uniref:Cytochrome P450 n=1 Tax=Angiostrongylus cantonensis TaxID=6313 RepID=A0A0K0D0Z2_ANGCA
MADRKAKRRTRMVSGGEPLAPGIGTNAKWFKRRKLLTSAFHFNVLQGYHDIFAQQGEILVNLIAEEKGFFDLFPYIKRCALDIICETAMGTAINSQTNGNSEYVLAVQRLTSILWKYQRFPWLWLKPIWYLSGIGFEFNRLVKLTNDFTRKVIADRKRSMEEGELNEDTDGNLDKKKRAFLDLLLHMQRSDELTDDDVREEVDTFMFEGHDTTSSGIGFTVWWLGQMPECQKKVHEELDSVFGDSDRLPTPEDLRKLVYLEKCIKESLRLTPSVPLVARKLSNNVLIGDVMLPEGLSVVIAPMITARDKRYWERPEEFYPEHFDAEKVTKRDTYAYIPFSAGPRNCIGQKFALLEEKAVLSWIFRRYHVETEDSFPGSYPIPQLVLTPLNGIRVRLTKR